MTLCPCCKATETLSYKKSSLTYRPSNSLIERKHPTTPTESYTNRKAQKSLDRKPEFVYAAPSTDLPYYASASSRYTPPLRDELEDAVDVTKTPSKKALPTKTKSDQQIKRPQSRQGVNKSKSTSALTNAKSTPSTNNNPGGPVSATPTESSLAATTTATETTDTDLPSTTKSLQHIGEEKAVKKRYYKSLAAGPEGRGLTRAERVFLVEYGDGHTLSTFSRSGGKIIKKRTPTPPKKQWKFPTILIWKAKQKFLSKRKIKEIVSPEPLDKLIDEGKKWQKKKKHIPISQPKSKPKHKPTAYFDTKIDGKPVLASFGKKKNLVGHSNYTCPESIPRMLKGYCMIEPFEPGNNICMNPDIDNDNYEDINEVGTQIRNPCVYENYATHNLQIVQSLSNDSLACLGRQRRDQSLFNHTSYSNWPSYQSSLLYHNHNQNPDSITLQPLGTYALNYYGNSGGFDNYNFYSGGSYNPYHPSVTRNNYYCDDNT